MIVAWAALRVAWHRASPSNEHKPMGGFLFRIAIPRLARPSWTQSLTRAPDGGSEVYLVGEGAHPHDATSAPTIVV